MTECDKCIGGCAESPSAAADGASSAAPASGSVLEKFAEAFLGALVKQETPAADGIEEQMLQDAANLGSGLGAFKVEAPEISEAEIAEITSRIRKARDMNDLAAQLLPIAAAAAKLLLKSAAA